MIGRLEAAVYRRSSGRLFIRSLESDHQAVSMKPDRRPGESFKL
jgi:hypothetical protein